MNRLLILSGKSVPVHKDYSTHPPQLSAWDDYNGGWGTDSRPAHGNVQAAMSFYNREKDGLGAPLPSGDLRIYEPDRAGSLRYAGAATIRDTPVDQKIDVTLSRAFDLFTEARLIKRQQPNRHTVRKKVELVLHNDKVIAADLRVVQGFGGRWKVVGESHKHANLDACTAQWTVRVPAGGKVILTYTIDLAC